MDIRNFVRFVFSSTRKEGRVARMISRDFIASSIHGKLEQSERKILVTSFLTPFQQTVRKLHNMIF